MRAALWEEPESRGGDGPRRKTAVCCIVLPLLRLLFWATGFFLRFLSVLGRECLPCLRWADWIDLPPLHVYRQLCLGLVGRRAAAPGKSAELPACWEKCEGQPGKFPNKSRASISFRSVAQTTFSLWKKAEWAFFIFPPAFWFPLYIKKRLCNLLLFFISVARLLRLASVVTAFYECGDMASTQKHTDIMLWGMCHCLCARTQTVRFYSRTKKS